jgi:hypothetical protein
MKHSVVANPELEVNIVGKTSIKKSLQQPAPIPNIDIVQRSVIAKGMMPESQVVIRQLFHHNCWLST